MKSKKTDRRLTRRQFLTRSSQVALGGTLLVHHSRLWAGDSSPDRASTVVLIRDPGVLDSSGQPVYQVVLSMLDQAVTALTGEKQAVTAWKSLIKADDVVGIKTNVWRYLDTTRQVEQALRQRVLDCGVSEKEIGIRDRGVLRDPLFQRATALINARPMRTHHWSGVGSLIKNYIMFVPAPYQYHPDSCADLATIWQKPEVEGKTRLNVLVMFTPQIHNVGPHGFNPKYLFRYCGLIVGKDPVACDTVGLKIIEARRRIYFGEDRPLNPPAKHIALADTRHHLGNSDWNRIRLIRLGERRDSLV